MRLVVQAVDLVGVMAEDPNFTPRNINELNVKWVSVGHGGKMNGKVAKELFELFSKK